MRYVNNTYYQLDYYLRDLLLNNVFKIIDTILNKLFYKRSKW